MSGSASDVLDALTNLSDTGGEPSGHHLIVAGSPPSKRLVAIT
jgi:hypothetical protein